LAREGQRHARRRVEDRAFRRHVGRVRVGPQPAQVRLAVWKARRRTGGCLRLRSPLATLSPLTRAGITLSGIPFLSTLRCRPQRSPNTSRQNRRGEADRVQANFHDDHSFDDTPRAPRSTPAQPLTIIPKRPARPH
jgi:hypothetical protein